MPLEEELLLILPRVQKTAVDKNFQKMYTEGIPGVSNQLDNWEAPDIQPATRQQSVHKKEMSM